MDMRSLVWLSLLGTLLCCSGKTVPAGEFPSQREREEVRIVLKSEPPTLNPLLTLQSVSRYVSEHIFQTLNYQNPRTNELMPALATVPETTTLSDGTIAYDYRLDSLARWPNGSRVTAHDVIFSLKALLNPHVDAGPYRSYYSMVSDVLVTSSDSLSFRVLTKRPYVLAREAIGDLYVYPRYAYDPDGYLDNIPLVRLTSETVKDLLESEEDGPLSRFATAFNRPERGYDPEQIVGSGPYKLESWQSGKRIKLRLRDNYWATDRKEDYLKAVPERLTFEIISDNTTTANALRDQLVDVVIDMPIDQYLNLSQEEYLGEMYDFVSMPSLKYYSILLNQSDPLFADSLTRKALAYLVDVDLIVDNFFPDLAQRVTGPVLPSKSYYNKDLKTIPYDVDKARKLLARAGWADTNGNGILDKKIRGEVRELSFNLLTTPNPTNEGICLYIAQTAAQVGIDMEVIRQEGHRLIERLNSGQFTASFYGLLFEPSPDDFSQMWLSNSVPPDGTNRGFFRNPEADSLIRQIAATTDSVARAPLYKRFQEIVYQNQPMIFLYSPEVGMVIAKRLDYTLISLAPNLHFNALRVRETS